MNHRHWRAWLGVVVIGTAGVIGCGGGDTVTGASAASSGASSGTGTGAGGGESTSTGTGSTSTGTGGTGGGMPTDKGVSGGALVSGGHVISSAQYKMVFTVGQSSPVQTNVSSPGYSLRGGLIGATGSAK